MLFIKRIACIYLYVHFDNFVTECKTNMHIFRSPKDSNGYNLLKVKVFRIKWQRQLQFSFHSYFIYLFIEIAVLTNVRRTATIQAKTYCNLYSLEQQDLFDILKNYPAIKSKLMNVAGERLQTLSRKRVVENCAHLFDNDVP